MRVGVGVGEGRGQVSAARRPGVSRRGRCCVPEAQTRTKSRGPEGWAASNPSPSRSRAETPAWSPLLSLLPGCGYLPLPTARPPFIPYLLPRAVWQFAAPWLGRGRHLFTSTEVVKLAFVVAVVFNLNIPNPGLEPRTLRSRVPGSNRPSQPGSAFELRSAAIEWRHQL